MKRYQKKDMDHDSTHNLYVYKRQLHKKYNENPTTENLTVFKKYRYRQ